MARMRLLDLTRPFSSLLPEISMPYQKVDQQERLVFTVAAAFVFVMLAEVPLFGTKDAMQSPDPISWLRPALGMSHGSLAELGVVPLVISGIVFQCLAGFRKINVALDLRSDRALFQSLQKLVALIVAGFFSVLLALTPGYFGKTTGSLFVASEIFVGSTFIILMDELLSKGYGMVPGSVLFTLISSSQYFTWQLLGVESIAVPGTDYTVPYGIIPSLFSNLNSRSYSYTLSELAFRSSAPNLLGLALSAVVFGITLYLSLIRLNLQVRSTRMRAQSSSFPVRLVYTGVVPILFVASVLAVVLLGSYSLSSFLGNDNVAVQILGQWDLSVGSPVGGLAALLVPNYSANPLVSLLRIAAYTAVFSASGAWVANVWTQSSGFAPQDIAKQFKENFIVLVGKRDVGVVKELRRVIPLAATIGGAVVGLFVGAADTIGPAGAGSVMSVAALNVFAVFEQLASEGMVGQEALQSFM